ncbi:sorbitol dehydrogenase [Burkholderia savannae]|nr:sorbitol dehydrogenase [Burkholderia savannae]
MDMPDQYRDDSPVAFRLSRRELIIGSVLMGGMAAWSAVPVWSSQPALTQEFAAQFMDLSALLIPHRLDPEIGRRIAAAMLAIDSDLPTHVAALIGIAQKNQAHTVEDFFPDVPEGALKETALAIVFVWYTGVIADEVDAEVFAFEKALMFQPTRDVMTIPSYAKSRPNGWTAEVPPLSELPIF